MRREIGNDRRGCEESPAIGEASSNATVISSDIDLLHEMNREVGWHAEYRQLEPGSLRVESSTREVGNLSILHERANRRLELAAEPPAGMVTVVIPEAPDKMSFNGCPLGPGTFGLFTPGAELIGVIDNNASACSLQIPAEYFAHHQRSLEPDRRTLAPGRVRVVRASLESHRRIQALAESSGRIGCQGIAKVELASLVVTALLECLGSDAVPAMGARGKGSSNPQILRVAREYIESHLDRPIRMPEVCLASGTSLRTLERVFRRELGMTPLSYIRVRRLNAVLEELKRPASRDRTISRIATEYGFNHLGRFSQVFHQHFGRRPAELRRSLHASNMAKSG